MNQDPRKNGSRRGVQTLELLFVLPILALLSVSAFGWVRTSMIRSCATHAAIAGAREGGKGADIHQITQAVNEVLAACRIAVSERQGSGAKMILQTGSGQITEFGDRSLSHGAPREIRRGEVCVTVWIAGEAPSAGILRLLQGPILARSVVRSESGPPAEINQVTAAIVVRQDVLNGSRGG